jgi:hypothetical protein
MEMSVTESAAKRDVAETNCEQGSKCGSVWEERQQGAEGR